MAQDRLREPTPSERRMAYLRCRSIADMHARADRLLRFHCPRPHRAAAALSLRGGGVIVVAFSGEESWHVVVHSLAEAEIHLASEVARLKECDRREARQLEAMSD